MTDPSLLAILGLEAIFNLITSRPLLVQKITERSFNRCVLHEVVPFLQLTAELFVTRGRPGNQNGGLVEHFLGSRNRGVLSPFSEVYSQTWCHGKRGHV